MREAAFVLAIDGPSGVGKGTVARAAARELGFRHVDTGAMYRAVAWLAVDSRVPLDDGNRVAALARDAVFDFTGGVSIDGHDVTQAIRTPAVDQASAAVARLAPVRRELVARQRRLVEPPGIVMEGRDIGTVVLPAADVKIFLDASPEERARRRASDPAHGTSPDRALADIASALAARDHQDRTRSASPLAVAPDAIVIDTTRLTADEVVRQVIEVVRRRLQATGRTSGS